MAAATVPDRWPSDHRHWIDAHLASCSACRQRLAEFRIVRALLQRRYPPVPAPRAWDAFTERLAERERRQAWPRVALATAALAVILIVLAAAQPGRRSSFSGVTAVPAPTVTEVTPTPYVLRDVAPSDPAVTSLGFTPVEPPRLPLGLVQTQRSTPSRNDLELLYEHESGWAILVAESPVGSTLPPSITVGEAGESTIVIDETTILVLNDPWPESVGAMFWEHDGLRFEIIVTEPPPSGLPRSDATQIAEALFASQRDSAE